MNTDSVKTEKDAVDDGKKKKALLMKSEDWRAVEVLLTGKKG
jgi:hypothetical protein